MFRLRLHVGMPGDRSEEWISKGPATHASPTTHAEVIASSCQLAIKQIVFKRMQIQPTNNTLIGYIDHTYSFYKSYILLTCTFSLSRHFEREKIISLLYHLVDILNGKKIILWISYFPNKPICKVALYIHLKTVQEYQKFRMILWYIIDTIFIQSYCREDKLLKCWLIKHWGEKVHGTEEEKNIW